MVEQSVPGGKIASRPLHVIWLLDKSGSMGEKGKISALNHAVKETIPALVDLDRERPQADLLLRVITFDTTAQWYIAQPTSPDQVQWTDLTAEGATAMGEALRLVAEALKIPPMETRALPPVLVLVSDGQPTDDFKSGLQALMQERWGAKAVRLAIAIGEDADREVLRQFIGHPEIQPLEAKNPTQLVQYFRWASTTAVASVSRPRSQIAGQGAGNVLIPQLPEDLSGSGGADEVW